MKRRTLIQTAGGGALGLLGAGLPLFGYAQDRYAKYKGQTVVLSIPAHPHYDAMVKLLPEFTKQTGIKVEVDKLAIPWRIPTDRRGCKSSSLHCTSHRLRRATEPCRCRADT